MSSSANVAKGAADDIRYRQTAKTAEQNGGAGQVGASSEDDESSPGSEEELQKDSKTYGRTPDGTIFTVPQTHDMVSQLLDPRQPKNLSDVVVIAILIAHGVLAFLLPANLKSPVFALIFIFWRAAYNIGIGFLLNIQSNHLRLVSWAHRWKLFAKPGPGPDGNPRPWLYRLLKREFEAKIPQDYSFDEAPIEYNTWLVFRRLVDLILMCDFTSYCLFAAVVGGTPENESLPLGIGRWALGIALVAFNLWVKLDAHRVVKDYAWYWGDFFFRIDQELTFDGVFEMAPHPMYSIGYIGYYGISFMAASFEVMFISIFAHICQLIFLVVVEDPHIEKTYNPPPPRKRTVSQGGTASGDSEDGPSEKFNKAPSAAGTTLAKSDPSPVHKLLGLKNLDLFRITDYTVILLSFYMAILTILTPSTPLFQTLFLAHAALWRFWYTAGLGAILKAQSNNKMWTRHFLKFGEDVGEAWRQWKGLYHISMSMSHTSLVAACWKVYSAPSDWNDKAVMLRHVIGASFVALQMWTAASIFEELGEFGWFCGDFFFDHKAKLTYKSIYRFLNNPERILGTAGFWGAALITWNPTVFVMALLSQLLTIGFINFVEKPHMQKIYGNSLRREAGLTKFMKRTLPPPVQRMHESVDNLLDGTTGFVEDFLRFAQPKLAGGVKTIVRDTTALFNTYPARLTLTRITADIAGYDPKHYALEIDGTPSSQSAVSERSTGKESLRARFPPTPREDTSSSSKKKSTMMILQYGAPVKVRWKAPAHHSTKDWIGLYMVTDNGSREKTEVPSLGRWAPTNGGNYDLTADKSILVAEHPVTCSNKSSDPSAPDLVSGTVVFEGDKLWWTHGVYEFRYHHDGRHNVMAISQPFEIRIGKFVDDDDGLADDSVNTMALYKKAVEAALLPVVQNCFDRDPDIAPATAEEPFGAHVERDSKYARRVVYAIHQMFGIEFAPAVVPADGNVRKLAWRICNAKQVLAPYSMSGSKGSSTPTSPGEFAEKTYE